MASTPPPFYSLNNFSSHAIEFDGLLYPTAEHAYQATKCQDKTVGIMERILRAKFDQHSEVQGALKRSGEEDIVENSPIDSFWGEGADGKGQNQLGKLWMKIRSEL